MLGKHTFNSNKLILIAGEDQLRHHSLYLMCKHRAQTMLNAHSKLLTHRLMVGKMSLSREHIFKNIAKRCHMLSTKETLQTWGTLTNSTQAMPTNMKDSIRSNIQIAQSHRPKSKLREILKWAQVTEKTNHKSRIQMLKGSTGATTSRCIPNYPRTSTLLSLLKDHQVWLRLELLKQGSPQTIYPRWPQPK